MRGRGEGALGRRPSGGEPLTPAILPAYMRKSPKVTEVPPIPYLRGLSTGDSAPAFGEFFVTEAGLSASTSIGHPRPGKPSAPRGRFVTCQASTRLLLGRRRALQPPPGRGPPVLLGESRRRPDGRISWWHWPTATASPSTAGPKSLSSMRDRGLHASVLAVGDRALGFWGTLHDVFPASGE